MVIPLGEKPTTPCRVYRGCLDGHGYGSLRLKGGRGWNRRKLHRWVVEQYLGRSLAPTEVVRHTCDTRACFRFDHLVLGTKRENDADMWAKGRGVPPPHRLGSASANAKLTEDQVAAIKRRHEASHAALGREYGVTLQAIRDIRRGRTWRQVEP